MRAWQHRQAISPASRRIDPTEGRGPGEGRSPGEAPGTPPRTRGRVSRLRYLRGGVLHQGLARDGLTMRQAGTAENYRRRGDLAIGEPGAVKLKDLTAWQVRKALAELPTLSLRPPVLSARLARSLARGEQLRWQPVVDRRGRGPTITRVPCPAAALSANLTPRGQGPGTATSPGRSARRPTRKERRPCLTSE
jgi:hypothetical protein